MNSKLNKFLLSVGSIAAVAAPIASVVACTPWDKPVIDGDLTGAKSSTWHSYFKNSGEVSSPNGGVTFRVTVGGNQYKYDWTNADHAAVHGMDQQGLVDYLAGKLADTDTAITASLVKAAFNINHHDVK